MNIRAGGLRKDVFILGAGFSRAVSESMPLTDELGNQVLDRVSHMTSVAVPRHFASGSFEAWLSRIASDQPDLTLTENLANRHLFALCSDAIVEVLAEAVNSSVDELDAADWLYRLVRTWHARRSTVITFNQDVLVEMAVARADLRDWRNRTRSPGHDGKVDWRSLLDGQPPHPPTRLGGGPPKPTFRLLKLHGSTNWFWSPRDPSGVSTLAWYLPGELAPEQVEPDEESARRRELPGRIPLIVPPAAAKNDFYANPMLTEVWRTARTALLQPNLDVYLVGYSLPTTDLATSGMLSETIGDRADVRVTVVNPDASPVMLNVKRLGVTPPVLSSPAVPDAADDFTALQARRTVADLRDVDDLDRSVLVACTMDDEAKVLSHSRNGHTIELILEAASIPHRGTNVGPSGSPPPMSAKALVEALQDRAVERLEVVTPTGRTPIVGHATLSREFGAGNGRWLALISSEPIPAPA